MCHSVKAELTPAYLLGVQRLVARCSWGGDRGFGSETLDWVVHREGGDGGAYYSDADGKGGGGL